MSFQPLHDGNRRRSPLGSTGRRAKATSTPQLLEAPSSENRYVCGNLPTVITTYTDQIDHSGSNLYSRLNMPRCCPFQFLYARLKTLKKFWLHLRFPNKEIFKDFNENETNSYYSGWGSEYKLFLSRFNFNSLQFGRYFHSSKFLPVLVNNNTNCPELLFMAAPRTF